AARSIEAARTADRRPHQEHEGKSPPAHGQLRCRRELRMSAKPSRPSTARLEASAPTPPKPTEQPHSEGGPFPGGFGLLGSFGLPGLGLLLLSPGCPGSGGSGASTCPGTESMKGAVLGSPFLRSAWGASTHVLPVGMRTP